MPSPTLRRLLLPLNLIAVAVMLLFATSPASQAASLNHAALSGWRRTALQTQAAKLSSILSSYMTKSSATDPNYFSNGVWYATDGVTCWYCYASAATGPATLGVLENNPSLEKVAIETFNTAIAQHQLPNGAFADDTGKASQVGTGFFVAPLGIAYLELQSVLPAATRKAWATSIAAAANYLITSGATTWYINGNVNLRQTQVLWLAYMATGESQYLTDYENELSFTLNPPQSRWPGYGLHITQAPTNANGNGGAGYLAESNSGTDPGFDPNYTQAQLDTDIEMYVLTRQQTWLYLSNLEYNQLAPRINTSDWVLNATGGTRDSFMEPFLTSAVEILVDSGSRPDLQSSVTPSLDAIDADYTQAARYATNPNYYKAISCAFLDPLMYAEWPTGLDAAASNLVPASKTTPVASVVNSILAIATKVAIAKDAVKVNSAHTAAKRPARKTDHGKGRKARKATRRHTRKG